MVPSATLLGLLCTSILAINALPTNYEYYTSDGISSGLSADQPYFLLNGKNISIYSGAIHYFRVPRAYWRDRLKKLRAAGLNTVETYIAWNLHEPYSGVYDFGDGGSEMEDFLHIEEYLKTAQEEDLFVILRPGPYICSEFDFGGFPGWLLRDWVGFRTTDPAYVKYVERYFNVLLPILKGYQFTNGGPVIAFQVENEYGTAYGADFSPQKEHLEELRDMFISNGIVELLVTSDPIRVGTKGTVAGEFLQTANYGSDPETNLKSLVEMQPDRPVMTMEFWTGWFDTWGGEHHTVSSNDSGSVYEYILQFPASVNIYVFNGGTNFGFHSGAAYSNELIDNSGYLPIITSYEYDAPLNENGDYTDKYYIFKELLEKYNPVKTLTPDPPELLPKLAYPALPIDKQLPLVQVLNENAPYVIESETVVAMEKLDINDGSGQTHGYIAYRKSNVDLEANTVLMIEGHVCDTVVVLVDGVLVSPVLESKEDFDGFGYWRLENSSLVLNSESKSSATIDIIVEQWGRVNVGNIYQYKNGYKGLWEGDVYLNNEKVWNWEIIPLEFKKDWTNNLQGWSDKASNDGPALFQANLEISDEPSDTYLDMSKWTKGLVTVNGFPLGKYAKIGPQQTLYLPAPFLKTGSNDIVIFEHFKADDELVFATEHIWNN